MSANGSMRINLKKLLIIVAALTAIVPAGITAIGSAVEMREVIVNRGLVRSELLASSFASYLNTYLNARRRALETVAANVALLDDLNSPGLVPLLESTRAHYEGFSRVSVASPSGIVIAAAEDPDQPGGSAVGLNIADRGYFQELMRTRKSLVDDTVIISRTTGDPTSVIGAPVLGRNGEVRAVIITGVRFANLQAIANSYRHGTTGFAQIVSSDGYLMASPDREAVQNRESLVDTPLWGGMGDQARGQLRDYLGPNGRIHIAGFATVEESGWRVMLTQARAELDDEVLASYTSAGTWAGLAIAGAIFLALIMVSRISRPIESLRATAEAIAGGDLTRRASRQGPTELVDLATSVNGMADALQERIAREQKGKETLEASVNEMSALATRIAAGDLAARVSDDADDELSELAHGLNGMAESLERLVQQVTEATQSVTSSSTEILAATSQQVSAMAEEATAVKQTAATVAEVRQTAEVTAKKTRGVAEQAHRATSVAAEGRQAVDDSVRGSNEAKGRLETLATRILEFSEQAQAIADLNATVNDIAEQSNLLAVNAGIEAAKAGEAGKGFGVVANEVKALADRCKEATSQVRQIVVEIQKSAQAAVMAVEQSVKAADSGVDVAERAGESIGRLEQSIAEAAQAAQQIMASTEQQEAGMDQIAMAMHNIEQSSAQNVTATQQVERAARDLNELAQRLAALLSTTVGTSGSHGLVGSTVRSSRG